MKAKDIQVGDYLVFDPTNKNNQLEVGINVVQVHKIEKKFLIYHVYTFAIDNNSGDPNTTTGLDFKSNLRGEVPMLEKLIPKNSVIIRYPDNMPVISGADCELVAKMAGILFNNQEKVKEMFSDEEIIRVNTVLRKMSFYSKITEHYKNVYGGGMGG